MPILTEINLFFKRIFPQMFTTIYHKSQATQSVNKLFIYIIKKTYFKRCIYAIRTGQF